ncbi:dicarboxylate transporter 2.1, chloroplastic-like [Impatiens glandulifera]|uniref:dicarboxylate transporter 2.1, chloroplastic-like n=1 Tax=Impatiens glandulifera TaxID=253017 RepID=UPI001FB18309|nr:dicarboxylate transporter 2.1, chloroplastic-like [Impatiens glandulifera]
MTLPTITCNPSSSCPRFANFWSNWKGAKPIRLLISIAVGLIICFAVPKPDKIPIKGWQLLSIFLTTITGLIISPLPVGAWAFVCLMALVATRTLTFAAAFAAFTNDTIWLIVTSFFFSRGFVKTGLGDRIAMLFVRGLGKSTLGLSYGLVLSELVISPAMPSTTARSGGIFLPIIRSLAVSVDSHPRDVTSRKLGAYLIQSQLQSAGNSSALFLTAAAQNLLCIKLAQALGVQIPSVWTYWFKAAFLPAILAIAVTPLLVYKLYPPEIKSTPNAPIMAATRLKEMGSPSLDEWLMIGIMIVTVVLWMAGNALNIASVLAAMMGLSMLLLFGVIDWDDCLSEKSAWDTLVWFAVLIGMANQLTTLGVVTWISDGVANTLSSGSMSLPAKFFVMQAAYFGIHYMFASQTAHVGALFSAFLAMQLKSTVPGRLAALALAYNTNLFGALTHYSSGQAAVYFGAGYVNLRDAFKLGIIVALVNIAIWVAVSSFWWKLVGLY